MVVHIIVAGKLILVLVNLFFTGTWSTAYVQSLKALMSI